VSHDTYTLDLAISFAAMIIIGGLRSITGSIIGASVVTLLPMAIRFFSDNFVGQGAVADLLTSDRAFFEELIYGLLVLMFLFFEPRGIVGMLKRLRRAGQSIAWGRIIRKGVER
jgi:branched-chain amino acid transport system permease protein